MKNLLLLLTIAFAITAAAQDEKTVTLVVSGQGETLDEAKQNALRSAIEQAFGTFISSNTEILNDDLVKDEIVSVANGNIQKFEIISEVEIPDLGYATTLKATVSVSKLTSFIESKGGEVEIKGSLFAFNINQQILNETSEERAIADLVIVLKNLIDKSFDYSVSSGTPEIIDGNNENWNIPIIITVNTNANFLMMYEYLVKTLNSISLSEEEVPNYLDLGKDVFFIGFKEPKVMKESSKKKKKGFLQRLDDRIMYGSDSDIDSQLRGDGYSEEFIEAYHAHEVAKASAAAEYNEFVLRSGTVDANGKEIEEINAEKIYLRTLNSYEKIITEFTLYFCKSMLSIKVEDNAGQYSFSPVLTESKFKSLFNPILFSYMEASSPREASNLFKIAQYLNYSYFIDNYKYQSIRSSNNPGNGSGYTFANAISLVKYSDGKEIAIITINKAFTLDQINQLSGFRVVNN
jgi:predicted RNase H-like HicB family nuclease